MGSITYISNINTLNEVVTRLNSRFDDKNLLSIFEREREHYVWLLTVLAILLTISVAYTIVTRFIEKDDLMQQEKMIVNHEKMLDKLQKQVSNQLQDIQNTILRLKVETVINGLIFDNTSLIGKNGKPISTVTEFLAFTKEIVKPLLELIRETKDEEEVILWSSTIRNIIVGVVLHSVRNEYIKDASYSRNLNPVFSQIISWIEDIIGRQKLDIIKKTISESEPELCKEM